MKFFSFLTVTLCATVFCGCHPYLPVKKVETMSGEQTAKKAGDSAREAQKTKTTGVLTETSNAFVEKKIEPEPEPEKQTLTNGAKIYMDHCGVCHGNGRTGGVAPLTNPGSLESILKVTRDGRPALGMPGWKLYLSEDEIKAVAQFVYDFQTEDP